MKLDYSNITLSVGGEVWSISDIESVLQVLAEENIQPNGASNILKAQLQLARKYNSPKSVRQWRADGSTDKVIALLDHLGCWAGDAFHLASAVLVELSDD